MATDEVVLEGGSRFLNKFIINQAKGALGGSGDDRYYYDQVISYFKKQPTVWIEFEKQARAEGHKEEREKVRCMGANCEKPPVWCNYAYHEQFEKGKKEGLTMRLTDAEGRSSVGRRRRKREPRSN